MRRYVVLAPLLFSACAAPRAEKMSFAELYATSGDDAAPQSPSTVTPARQALTPVSSVELQAALTSFVERARAYRNHVRRGSAMPAAQAENWEGMNGALDAFLLSPVERTDSRDVVRARGVLEAELELDARTYGDMPGTLAEAVVGRMGRLAVRMAELRRLEQPPEPSGPPRLVWPLAPVSITSLYGDRWHPIIGERRRHLGLDLAAKPGQAIYTADRGVVLRAGWNGDHGLQVEVQHEGRWVTRYSHLSEVLVRPGEILERGDALGLAGATGLATGVHLHFELWRDGASMDPLEALSSPEDAEASPLARGARSAADVVPSGEREAPATHQGRRPGPGQRP